MDTSGIPAILSRVKKHWLVALVTGVLAVTEAIRRIFDFFPETWGKLRTTAAWLTWPIEVLHWGPMEYVGASFLAAGILYLTQDIWRPVVAALRTKEGDKSEPFDPMAIKPENREAAKLLAGPLRQRRESIAEVHPASTDDESLLMARKAIESQQELSIELLHTLPEFWKYKPHGWGSPMRPPLCEWAGLSAVMGFRYPGQITRLRRVFDRHEIRDGADYNSISLPNFRIVQTQSRELLALLYREVEHPGEYTMKAEPEGLFVAVADAFARQAIADETHGLASQGPVSRRDSVEVLTNDKSRFKAARDAIRALMNEGGELATRFGKTQAEAIEWRDRTSAFVRACLGAEWQREFLNCVAGLQGPRLETDTSKPQPGDHLRTVYGWDWLQEMILTYCQTLDSWLSTMNEADLMPDWVKPPTRGTPDSPPKPPRPA